MSQVPGVSIVVTCYNLEAFIEDALLSVFAQDYTGPVQIIIVDDASTDSSTELIEHLINSHGENKDITFLRHEKNLGIAGTTDKAWAMAKYDWIIEADGDDIQFPNRCTQTMALAAQYPEAGLIIMSHECIDEQGIPFRTRHMIADDDTSVFVANGPAMRAAIYLEKGEAFPVYKDAYGCSMAIHKKLLTQWGPLASGNGHFAQDPPWQQRAFLSAPVVWSNALACQYRTHATNILNKARTFNTLQDYINYELDVCSYDYKALLAIQCMLQDARRAQQQGLTDWSSSDVDTCITLIQQYHTAHSIRAHWWGTSIFKRFYLVLKHYSNFPLRFKRYFLSRLLPLRLIAWRNMHKR
ncbi:MAG: glycosyltransferase family 2 protein [Akkermansia sp.]|nr:glycosyltransferase family 2 protein [Akkermansia sp.]